MPNLRTVCHPVVHSEFRPKLAFYLDFMVKIVLQDTKSPASPSPPEMIHLTFHPVNCEHALTMKQALTLVASVSHLQ